MLKTHCDYCGYEHRTDTGKAIVKKKNTIFKLAYPDLFEQEYNRINGVTTSRFNLLCPLSNGQYIRLEHLKYSHSKQYFYLRYGRDKSDIWGLSTPINKCAFLIDGENHINEFQLSLDFFKILCETRLEGFTYNTTFGNVDIDDSGDLSKLQIFFQAAYEGIMGCGMYKNAIQTAKSYDIDLRNSWMAQERTETIKKRLVVPISFLLVIGMMLVAWFFIYCVQLMICG